MVRTSRTRLRHQSTTRTNTNATLPRLSAPSLMLCAPSSDMGSITTQASAAHAVDEDEEVLAWTVPKLRGSITPTGRYGHTLSAIHEKYYCFGGVAEVTSLSEAPAPNNELYCLTLRGDSGEWSLPETSGSPPPRWQHTATVVDNNRIFVRQHQRQHQHSLR